MSRAIILRGLGVADDFFDAAWSGARPVLIITIRHA